MYANLKTLEQSLALPLTLRTEAGIVANPGPKDYYDAQVSGVKAADLGLTPVYLRGWRKGGEQ